VKRKRDNAHKDTIMLIDIHGHFTTLPESVSAFRKAQIDAFDKRVSHQILLYQKSVMNKSPTLWCAIKSA